MIEQKLLPPKPLHMSPLKFHHIIKGSIKRLPSQGEPASERDRKTRRWGRTVSWKQWSNIINQPVAEILGTFKSPRGLLQPVVVKGDCSFSCAVHKSGTGHTGSTVQLCIQCCAGQANKTFTSGTGTIHISDRSRHQSPARTWAGNCAEWGLCWARLAHSTIPKKHLRNGEAILFSTGLCQLF